MCMIKSPRSLMHKQTPGEFKAAAHAEDKLQDLAAETGPCTTVCNRAAAVRPLLPAGVYTCTSLGNICAHNAKGGRRQRLTVKPDHRQYR